ncbi:MAG: TetR/AcrR family transcriptional regulator C-terminal domain-containing protein [Bacilli bacterium]|nr:TetR/AcrR family transcriptional regulator C-terminal domain-containing protein [Bacilli bacterium]
MENKNDLRVIKTKKILFEALINLMKKESFEKIKVSDICNEALVNRSTFYAHYDDKLDLLIAIIDDLKNNLEKEFERNEEKVISKKYYMKLIKIFIIHIDENRDTYASILANDKNGTLIDLFIDVGNRDIINRLRENDFIESDIPIEIISKFYLGAIVSIGIDWISNKDTYSKEQLMDYLDKLIPDKL